MENERQQEINEALDHMWQEHILACLAIINAWENK